MSIDPTYARSAVQNTNAETAPAPASAPPPPAAPSDGGGDEAAASGSAAAEEAPTPPAAETPQEVAPDTTSQAPGGAQEGAAAPTEGQVQGEAASDAQGATLSPEDAARLLADDPLEFARKHNVNLLPRQFADLAKQSAALRQREDGVKEAEQRAKDADAMLADLRRDPIAFVERHAGADVYRDWTKRKLGKKDETGSEVVEKLLSRIEQLEAKLTEAPQQATEAATQTYYNQRAEAFISDVVGSVGPESHPNAMRVYDTEEIVTKTAQLFQSHLGETGLMLTGGEALRMLEEQVRARLEKPSQPAGGEVAPPAQPAPSPQASEGPATLTPDLQSAVASGEPEDELDLPDHVVFQRIAQRHS